MGHAIAARLTSRLDRLAVSDLRRENAADLISDGAIFYDTAGGAARHSDIIVLSLNTPPIVEQDACWVDAPLSGGAPGALAGRLSLMVGGDESAVTRARPRRQREPDAAV